MKRVALCCLLGLCGLVLSVFADQTTRLQLVGSPDGTFVSRGPRVRLTHVSVTVKNSGSATAKGVRVTATLPDGQTVRLNGPKKLAAKEQAQYRRGMNRFVASKQNIKASADCKNCS